MSWDEPTAAMLTRATARVSAALFAGYLATLAGHRLLAGHRGRFVGALAPRVFVAFVVAHTVHFAAVAVLTVVTGGANIEARGGGLAVGAVGVLFYVAVFAIWRAERAWVESVSTRRPREWLRVVAVTLIWLAFAQAYLLRIGHSPLFLLLGAALLLGFAGWLVSLRRGKS